MAGSTSPDLEELLPLASTGLHILLALAGGMKHGYGIMKAIEDITEGQVHLGPGTLYGAIKRLLADGLIEESDERPDPYLDDERRRYYRLTPFGQQALKAEVARLSQLIRFAESI